MKREEVEDIISEWAVRTGNAFQARDLDILVEMIADASQTELADLRNELSPINDDWGE